MTTTTPAGYALYIEARRKATTPAYISTYQLLFIPEVAVGTTIHKGGLYRRRISPQFPRKQWKFYRSSSALADLFAAHSVSVGSAATRNVRDDAMAPYAATLRTLIGDHELAGTPIIVEMSAADVLDHVALGKTPYKILGRVWKTRKVTGYPAEFL